MKYTVDIKNFKLQPVCDLGADFSGISPSGGRLSVNSCYPEKDGVPFIPVSGECHYSRLDPRRWEDELIKMRMGGINAVSTYIFWNHLEETEGDFDFSGKIDLRRFVLLCQKHGLYVILRVGPFAHGEVRNGGLPDWLYGKPFDVRTTDPGFLDCVKKLYGAIGAQVRGLFFGEGGPIIAVQLDNEYMHSASPWEMTAGTGDEWTNVGNEGESYLLALRSIALECGLCPVFFTSTAWGGAAYSPRILPLWGGYAYRPWLFYGRTGEHPATEEYVYEDYHHSDKSYADDFAPAYAPEERPYACCEMGAGMTCCYQYRFRFPGKSADALSNVKLGSGCNFIGYYMYHGGTNPLGRHGAYLNERPVPKRSYDYQAPLGESGQLRESYARLKAIHFFTRFFGARLAPLETVLPGNTNAMDPTDTAALRFALRTDGKGGFLFINNFQDHLAMPEKKHESVEIQAEGESIVFDVSLAADENAILPFNLLMDGILLKQANAQPVLRSMIGGRITYVFMVPEGMNGAFRFEDGTKITEHSGLMTAKKGQSEIDILVLSRAQANRLFLLRDGSLILSDAALLEDAQGALWLETLSAENILECYPPNRLEGTAARRLSSGGPFGKYRLSCPARSVPFTLAESAPRRWTLRIGAEKLRGLKDARLQIDYAGDVGMLFLNNALISDNFSNGCTWETGLLEHREALKTGEAVLVISPLKEGAKVKYDSPMAARSEEVASATAALKDVRIQPVYEIAL